MSISVSVIIPVYNVEKYLAACLDSVLAQTLKNIEVICVNDCSTDKCDEILLSFAHRNNRLKIVNHDINAGLAASRNTGLDYCSGEYIFFLDSDDLLFSSDSLAHLYSIAKNDDADEVIGAMLRWDENTEERLFGYHTSCLKYQLNGGLFRNNQHLRSNVTACNKLLRHTFLDKNNLRFNANLRKFEDNSFSWQVHLLAQSISLTLQATYLHRQRTNNGPPSIMQKKDDDFVSHILAAEDMLTFLANNPQFSDLRHNFDRYFFYWLQNDVRLLEIGAPDSQRKKEVFELYLPVLNKIPESSLRVLPKCYLEILSMMRNGKIAEAWEVLVDSRNEHSEMHQNPQLIRLQKQLDKIYNSTSWRITSPFRKIARKFKGVM